MKTHVNYCIDRLLERCYETQVDQECSRNLPASKQLSKQARQQDLVIFVTCHKSDAQPRAMKQTRETHRLAMKGLGVNKRSVWAVMKIRFRNVHAFAWRCQDIRADVVYHMIKRALLELFPWPFTICKRQVGVRKRTHVMHVYDML